MPEVTSNLKPVQQGDWTIGWDNGPVLLYRGSPVSPPSGYDTLIFELAMRVRNVTNELFKFHRAEETNSITSREAILESELRSQLEWFERVRDFAHDGAREASHQGDEREDRKCMERAAVHEDQADKIRHALTRGPKPVGTSENGIWHEEPIVIPATASSKSYEIGWPEKGDPYILFNGERIVHPNDTSSLPTWKEAAEHYATLAFKLGEVVNTQRLALDELAEDPDVAVPATTRDNERAILEVARIAVDAVIDNPAQDLRPDKLRVDLAEHFASLLGHYSRRTENLMRERDGLTMQLQDAKQAEWQAAMNSGYWHQRCCYVEEALLPFSDAFDAIKNIEGAQTSMGTITLGVHDTRVAHLVLSEMRKDQDGGPGGSYERFTRDNRQVKIFDWVERTFTTPDFAPTTLDERAFRFLEEALELWQSAINADLVDRHGGPTFQVKKAEDWTAFADEWAAPYLDKLNRLIGRVLSGEPGEIGREFGGTMITLAGLAQVTGHSLAHEEVREFTRVVSVPRDTFQARHQVKRDAGI